ncbi:phytoene desaturase family protein [Roseibacillus ishigakijimensis]|uniref:Phytoene desaturase n=1 Tax=Roseibacillus ishigakijimensis TaxID=454146 RepID=A0A934RRD7_9BACT|nr:phytoene desaturase family protein [Roseibacillus ishigakijimensis]MBK1835555.1 phytoene desaturase [Roseibacillus ishigakijimensis]
MQGNRVAVIGAGLGGMSAAISLRAEGYAVEIFEKNKHLGGKLNVLAQEGFTFDLGPSIFTLPALFGDLFRRAGKDMADYVSLQAVTPHWRNFFDDGLVLDLFQEDELMRRELAKLPGDAEAHWRELQDFLSYARKQYEVLNTGYLQEGIDGLWEFLKHYGLKKIGREIDYRKNMSESVAERLSSPALRSIFEYFIKYVGSSALDAPGYMNMMPIIQFDHGLWYVEGGMYRLAEGLEKLMAEMEIPIHLEADVTSITKSNNRVTGLELADGSQREFDLIVSNMEVIPTYEKLLGESDRFLRKYKKFQPACSGLVIHLGTDRIYPELAHHNFVYSRDQHKHFDTVFQKKELPDDPTLYVVAPTRTDTSKAPPGCDNIKILPHIPPLAEGQSPSQEDYLALRERVLDKMEKTCTPELRKHIVTEDFLTPVDIERLYRSNRGSIYGVVSDWKLNRGFKAPKTSSKYKNLYFCGGSINPGGGMPMVILSGQKVADRIVSDRSSS